MGTPVPPNEPGDLCTICWGPGRPHGPGPTPKVLRLVFSGLLPGEFWSSADEQSLLWPHYLIQSGVPCDWLELSTRWRCQFSYTPITVWIVLRNLATNRLAFLAIIPPSCTLFEPNEITDPLTNFAYSGNVTVDWDLKGL